jgi:hypothetical protein
VAAVRGVPIETIRASIDSLLKGSPPASIDADTWRHVRVIYRGNEGNPYWMTSRGLDRNRAGQLTNVVVASIEDALNAAALPLAATVEALDIVRGRSAPGAAEMARADVLMTTLYAGIAEQLLVGHINPRTVSQSWYIDPREDRVDSAMVRMHSARCDQVRTSTMRYVRNWPASGDSWLREVGRASRVTVARSLPVIRRPHPA